MAHIEFFDATMRDGQQSLWGMRMQAGMACRSRRSIDRAGFSRHHLAGSSPGRGDIKTAGKSLGRRWISCVQAMPRTPHPRRHALECLRDVRRHAGSLMDAWMRRLKCARLPKLLDLRRALRRRQDHRLAKVAQGIRLRGRGLVCSRLSPVHTDAYYAAKADRVCRRCPEIDTILSMTPPGCWSKERLTHAAAGVSKPRRQADRIPRQQHSATRASPISTRSLGATILHTASRPMANGPSVPSTETWSHNLELLGHTHNRRQEPVPRCRGALSAVGKAAGILVNQAKEYDVLFRHQMPGGMISTLKAQLVQHNMTDKLDEVLRETGRVAARARLSRHGDAVQPARRHPGGAQRRHGRALQHHPDEVIAIRRRLSTGTPSAPIDPNVLDRIMACPARQASDRPRCRSSRRSRNCASARGRTTTTSSSCALGCRQPDLEKMRAAGPVKRDSPTALVTRTRPGAQADAGRKVAGRANSLRELSVDLHRRTG